MTEGIDPGVRQGGLPGELAGELAGELPGEYGPSPTSWVRDQVATIEAAGDTGAVSIHGLSVMLLTMRGRSTGLVRKVPLVRVEEGGRYAAVGSRGGAPTDPKWVANLRADPDILLQDGTVVLPVRARELLGSEREEWWQRCVAVFGDFAAYQTKTSRIFPMFVLEPR